VRSVSCGLLLLALGLGAGLWAWTAMPRDGTVIIPLSRSSEIDMNLWTVPGGLRAALWHQNTARSINTRLALATLPAWPVVALSAGAGIGAGAWIVAASRKRAAR
jgi:hypothetical protein